MPIYDNDGTAYPEIGTLHDGDGTSLFQIKTVHDYNGTDASLIYELITALAIPDINLYYPGGPNGTSFKKAITSDGLDLREYNRLVFTFNNDGRAGYWAGGPDPNGTDLVMHWYSNSSYILRGDDSHVAISNTSYNLDISGWTTVQKSNVRFYAEITGSCSSNWNSDYSGGIHVTNIVAS